MTAPIHRARVNDTEPAMPEITEVPPSTVKKDVTALRGYLDRTIPPKAENQKQGRLLL